MGATTPEVLMRRKIIVELYRRGLKGEEIARRAGVSRMMVYKHLAQAGEPRKRTNQIDDPDSLEARILALRSEGLLMKQIAHEVGRSMSTVTYYARKAS